MFFHWFGVEAVNTSNLLFLIQSVEPGKSAWEALDYIPIALTFTIVVTLSVAVRRLIGAFPEPSFPLNAPVALLGLVSVGLIAFRIVDPPVFLVEQPIRFEGWPMPPVFLALLAAAGIAFGGWRALKEEKSFG